MYDVAFIAIRLVSANVYFVPAHGPKALSARSFGRSQKRGWHTHIPALADGLRRAVRRCGTSEGITPREAGTTRPAVPVLTATRLYMARAIRLSVLGDMEGVTSRPPRAALTDEEGQREFHPQAEVAVVEEVPEAGTAACAAVRVGPPARRRARETETERTRPMRGRGRKASI